MSLIAKNRTPEVQLCVPLGRIYAQSVKDRIGVVALAALAMGHVVVYLPITPDPPHLMHWASQQIPLGIILVVWMAALMLCVLSLIWRCWQPYAVSYCAAIAFMWGVSFLISARVEGVLWWSGACDYLGLAFFITWGFSRQQCTHNRKSGVNLWETQQSS